MPRVCVCSALLFPRGFPAQASSAWFLCTGLCYHMTAFWRLHFRVP